MAWDGESEGYVRVPGERELDDLGRGAAYAHITSNETIQGVQWPSEPTVTGRVPVVCDMSSDFLSRPVEIQRYGLIYAGAQKNAGPAGVTIVIARDDVISRGPAELPTMLDYRTFAKHGSLYNTPPAFAIYVVMLVTQWLRDDIGGLEKMAEANAEKAALLYDEIDASEGFYAGQRPPGQPVADARHMAIAER